MQRAWWAGQYVLIAFLSTLCAGALADDEPAPKASPVAIGSQPLKVKTERAFPKLQLYRPEGSNRPTRPVGLTAPPDGTNRIAVIQQRGQVVMFPNDPEVEEASVVLDIEPKVAYKDTENEEGLLGIAFHPQFKENREFFLYYVLRKPAHTVVVSRFKMSADDPNRADPDSEEELLRVTERFWNHKGGTVAFGPDGYLYIAIGDGGYANDPDAHGQSLSTMMAKILRIDVDHKDQGKNYAVPKDNPFVDVPGATREIWALGLRNVWRLAFDRKTGAAWAGDVGQDTWEEVDIIERGGNYGWNIREGFHPFTTNRQPTPGPAPDNIVGPLLDPIFEYHHDVGKSITGGCVYRGPSVPELTGAYLFADYISGKHYALRYDEATNKVTSVDPIESNNLGNLGVFSFGEDENGEVYYTTTNGAINRYRSDH